MSPAAGRIVEAARTIAAARGLDALSVQAVATAAGVHKSAIGYHFGNKQGLVLALIESLGHEESNKARRAVGRVADPSERFHAYLSLYRELVMTSDHWRLAIALGPAPHYDEKTKVLGRSVALDWGVTPAAGGRQGARADVRPAGRHHRPRAPVRGQGLRDGSGGVLCAARGSARASIPPGDERRRLDHLLSPPRGGVPGRSQRTVTTVRAGLASWLPPRSVARYVTVKTLRALGVHEMGNDSPVGRHPG